MTVETSSICCFKKFPCIPDVILYVTKMLKRKFLILDFFLSSQLSILLLLSRAISLLGIKINIKIGEILKLDQISDPMTQTAFI